MPFFDFCRGKEKINKNDTYIYYLNIQDRVTLVDLESSTVPEWTLSKSDTIYPLFSRIDDGDKNKVLFIFDMAKYDLNKKPRDQDPEAVLGRISHQRSYQDGNIIIFKEYAKDKKGNYILDSEGNILGNSLINRDAIDRIESYIKKSNWINEFTKSNSPRNG